MREMDCVILIPALDPPEVFPVYLVQLRQRGFCRIIVVDDGSGPEARRLFDRAEQMGCVVLHHPGREGKGAALKTGFACYQDRFQGKCSGIVTVSDDGTDSVEDVARIAAVLEEEWKQGRFELVLGSRDFSGSSGMSAGQASGNRIGCLLCRVLLNISLKDMMTGLRGIPDSRVSSCLDIPGKGYEYETAMLLGWEQIGYQEIQVLKTAGKPGHSRSGMDTVRNYLAILKKFLMFAMVSILVSVFDIFLFWLFTEYFLKNVPYPIIWSTIIARIISASVNYVINRQLVFCSNEDQRRSAGQFVALSIGQCLVSAILVHLLELLVSGEPVLIKVVVDTALFFVNYKIQQKYIFRQEMQE